ncbi:aspartate--tRNA(Asn) ligase [bacterium]|nr:aspartate--tRNA(Asn) ligase [bacterium]
MRNLISEIKTKLDQSVTIKGRLISKRELGSISFLKIQDFTGICQFVTEDKSLISLIESIHPQSILEVEGKAVSDPKGNPEIHLESINVINAVKETPGIDLQSKEPKEKLETILSHRAISLRHPKYQDIFKVEAAIIQSYREFMTDFGATEFFSPLILASSSEGGAEIFELEYFDSKATLAQSAQLYKQIMVGVYERVFGLSKCFRAENSNTRRHVTEATQLEFEMGFIESIDDILEVETNAIKYILEKVYSKCEKELDRLKARRLMVPEGTFPKLTFDEACGILDEKFKIDTEGWDDLTTESERLLCEYAREEFNSDFIFVTNFKKAAFYAYRDKEGMIHNVDLLCKEMEISSGGRRFDSYDDLKMSIVAEGMDPQDFSEYLSIFKFGMPPHGGFGIGFERLVMLITGQDNIRECILFPSDPKRIASQNIK